MVPRWIGSVRLRSVVPAVTKDSHGASRKLIAQFMGRFASSAAGRSVPYSDEVRGAAP
jgi:hypothetical protein